MHHNAQKMDAARGARKHHGLGLMRLTRPQLAVGAIAFTALMASLPTLPASADPVPDTEAQVELQTMKVSETAVDVEPAVDRGDFSVSYFTVVQSPVARGTGITSGYGPRIPPCAGCSSYHNGVDYHAPFGSAVVAMADGVVTEAGMDPSFGVYLRIQHNINGQTVTTTYAHMQGGSLHYGVGNKVKHGAVVGQVGSTGQSTGAHLYFEIRLGDSNGPSINPVPWLRSHVNG